MQQLSSLDSISDQDLSEYAGKWIIISNGKIVSSGDDLKGIIAETRSKIGNKRIFFMKVPNSETLII